jgi:prevent-host-death family protein
MSQVIKMTLTVGTFEAKTKFSELLNKVETGEEVVITRHGKVIAKIVPAEQPKRKKATVEELLEIGRAFSRDVVGEFTSADIDNILYDEDGLPK